MGEKCYEVLRDGALLKPGTFLAVLLGLIALRAATLDWLPVVDPSEARYALVGRDMAVSGDWVTPMIWENGQYIPFFSKPPLLFWIQAAFMRAVDMSAFAARLPSFLGAVAVLFSCWFFLRKTLPTPILQGALLILLSSPLFFIVAGLALTDMLLCLTVTGALFSHYAFTLEQEPRRARSKSLATFAFLGFGMLAKGPVALALFGLPALAWAIWQKNLGHFTKQAWVLGVLLFAAIAAPWYALAERANPGFLEYFLLNENLLRFTASDFGDRYGAGHRYPRGMALLFFLLAMLPWVVVLAVRLRTSEARRSAREAVKQPDIQYFLVSLGGILLFLGLSRHILGTYVLPAMPAAAIVGAALLLHLGVSLNHQARIAAALAIFYTLAILLALPIVRGHRSSEEIARIANGFQEARGADGFLMFVGHRPFSARFYAGEKGGYLSWDASNEEYRWHLEPGNGTLFIFQKKHVASLDEYVRLRIREIGDSGSYSLWEPTLPPEESQDGPPAG